MTFISHQIINEIKRNILPKAKISNYIAMWRKAFSKEW